MNYLHKLCLILCAAMLIAACSDNSSSPVNPNPGPDPDPQPEASARYVIAANPQALEDVADYLLTSETLTEGSVSTIGNGIEQDGTYRYYTQNNNKFYSLLYGQGDPGAVTSYELGNNGALQQLVNFQSETVQVFANVGDDVLMARIPRSATDSTALWFQLSTQTDQFSSNGQINTYDVSTNNEMAFFSWITQVNGQVWMPYFTISGSGNNGFSTQNPDSAWVSVFSYPEMELQTVIKDDRTSFIGRYFTKGLSVDEQGDVYAFSSSVAQSDDRAINSTKPSAITRIPNGTTAFDDYYYNLEQASGGYYLTNHHYLSDGNVLGYMQPVAERGAYTSGHRLAIINVYEKSFTWVDGMPDETTITSITATNPYISDGGTSIAVGVTTEQNSIIYTIDAPSATASAGLEVEGGRVTAIHRLEPAN